MNQEQVASAFGLKSHIIQYCEKSGQNGEKFEIPKAIMLAYFTITLRVDSYSGPGPAKNKIEADNRALARLFNL